jgi:hypothetical protein
MHHSTSLCLALALMPKGRVHEGKSVVGDLVILQANHTTNHVLQALMKKYVDGAMVPAQQSGVSQYGAKNTPSYRHQAHDMISAVHLSPEQRSQGAANGPKNYTGVLPQHTRQEKVPEVPGAGSPGEPAKMSLSFLFAPASLLP